MENYWILPVYHKCVLFPLIWIMSLTINLISGTHNYVRGEICIYGTPRVLNNYSWNLMACLTSLLILARLPHFLFKTNNLLDELSWSETILYNLSTVNTVKNNKLMINLKTLKNIKFILFFGLKKQPYMNFILSIKAFNYIC